MRYVFLLLIVSAICFFFLRGSPAISTPKAAAQPRTATQTTAASPSASPQNAPGNLLKRPLDRTHQVLDQVHRQRDENSF